MKNRALRTSISDPDLGGLTGQERTRMLALFVLAVVLTGCFLYAWDRGRRSETPEPTVDVPRPEPDEITFEMDVVPWNPPVEQINELVHEGSQLQRVKAYPAALNILAKAIRNHRTVHLLHDPALKEVGGFQRLAGDDLDTISDPENAPTWRGRPIDVIGRVVTSDVVDPVTLGLDPEVFRIPLQRGVLDVDGREVLFLMASDFEVRLLQPEERIKILGVYYRVKEVPRDWAVAGGVPAEYAVLPMILGKEILGAVPLKLRDALPAGFADSLKGLSVERIKKPPQEDGDFFTLLGYVLGRGEAALGDEEPVRLRSRKSLDRPDDFVARPVWVWGQIVYLAWESFDIAGMREEDATILGYWHAIVADPRPEINPPVSVILPVMDLPEGIVKGAWVNAEGLFFRVHAFENRKGKEGQMPMMIATSMPELATLTEDRSVGQFLWVFAAAGLLLVGGLLLMVVRDRRRGRRLDAELRERRTTRRRREGMDLNVLLPPHAAEDADRDDP